MKLEKTFAMNSRALDVIAHGALTNSKRPQSFVFGAYPTHLVRGMGCHVWDVDGNKYVDFICSLGAILLGYRENKVNEAVRRQLEDGSIFSLGSSLEVRFCERMRELFPYLEKVRVLKSGSEACSAAIRIARSFTKRKVILSEGYHGHHDLFVSMTPPADGVFDEFKIQKFTGEVYPWAAAVIVEPIITDYSQERLNQLKKLREDCTRLDVLLIFDEVITAFRFPGLSVAKWSGIYPDISIMGKALGGGLPLYVVGGRREVMESQYFISSTFAGDTTAMAAGLAVIDLLNSDYSIDQIWQNAGRFQIEFNAVCQYVVQMEGYPTRGIIQGSDLNKALFFQESVRAGLLFGPSYFWMAKHQEETHRVLNILRPICTRIRNNEVKLEGEMPQKPFAQKQREN